MKKCLDNDDINWVPKEKAWSLNNVENNNQVDFKDLVESNLIPHFKMMNLHVANSINEL